MNKPKKPLDYENIPFQVKDVIEKLLTGKDQEYIKENYRNRLIDIRDAVTFALSEYDDMLKTRDFFRNGKKKK